MLNKIIFKNKFLINQNKTSKVLIYLWLIISIAAIYYQVLFFDFINYDTPDYVYNNIYVKQGISLNSILWAFSTIDYANWHPVTWISHMIDVELFGLNSGAHNAVNVFFHIINSLTLCWIIKKISGSLWSSWFIASLFALHPLHVQSVAWLAERKDLLSTMFGFFSIISYCYYITKKESSYYLLVILLFLLSLMSKPTLVTLPFILLLMDYWPLNRLNRDYTGQSDSSNIKRIISSLFPLIIEKIPIFFLSAISCIITLYAQHSDGTMSSITSLPVYIRVLNIITSYAKYVFLMFYPINLSIIYPYPKEISFYNAMFSTLFLFGMCCFALWNIKKRPWLFMGWFFFIGTLVPVIGIIQVGEQAMADRYTYVPLIGLFIIIAASIKGGINYLKKCFNLNEIFRWLLSFSILLILTLISWKQAKYWENSITIFSRAIEVTDNNHTAHNNLGTAFTRKREYKKAEAHFINAIKYNPNFAIAHANYATLILSINNNVLEAIKHYKIAINLKPDYVDVYISLGMCNYKIENYPEAMKCYLAAYKLDPYNIQALNGIAALMAESGMTDKAVYFLKKALEINPESTLIKYNLKKILDMP